MKQVLLDPRSGRVSLVDVPAPSVAADRVLVRTHVSVVSAGTERQLIDLSSKGAVSKARARPEAARQVVDTVLREGVRSAMWKAQARLDHPFSLGYSLSGSVQEVGNLIHHVEPGGMVACGGAGLAVHAEAVSIPPLLAVPVPSGVSAEEAAFAYIGAIALHAVRLAGIGPGGSAAVIGLGLVGQLTSQLLAASGVWTVGVDPDGARREIAAKLTGAETYARASDAVSACQARGGTDAVLVTAAGEDPSILAPTMEMARDRGQIVVVGSVPISLDRDRMYQKELSLVVARSSGPGRYEPSYELDGVDLPIGHVRWTEGRNMSAFLDLARRGRLPVSELVTHRFPITQAESAYELMETGREPFLAIVLEYDPSHLTEGGRLLARQSRSATRAAGPRISVIGAGAFARSVLLPRLERLSVELGAVATATGASAAGTATRFGFRQATTDPNAVIADPDTNGIVIATRHDLHASYAAQALAAGRNVYVEKPLARNRGELAEVFEAWRNSPAILSVGFNRRFSPLLRRLHRRLGGSAPITASYVVNVAPLPPGSWVNDPDEGGGVVMAEGGHFIDALTFLAGSHPVEVSAIPAGPGSYQASLRFANGSVATILYTTGALGQGPKELLIVAGRGVLAHLHDFRTLTIWARGRKSGHRERVQDKGHGAALEAWVESIRRGGSQPVDMLEIVAVSEATICMSEALASGQTQKVILGQYVQAVPAGSPNE